MKKRQRHKFMAFMTSLFLISNCAVINANALTSVKSDENVTLSIESGAEKIEVCLRYKDIDAVEISFKAKELSYEYAETLDKSEYSDEEIERLRFDYYIQLNEKMYADARNEITASILSELGVSPENAVCEYGSPEITCTLSPKQIEIAENMELITHIVLKGDWQSPYDRLMNLSRDDMKLAISYEISTGRNELWIDDTYRYLSVNLYRTTAAVRMTDGTEPPVPEDSDSCVIQKLSGVQKLNFLTVESIWFMDADDIKLSDDLYVINGFKNADAAEEYCKKLLASGKADYAEPVVTGKYNYIHPYSELLNYFTQLDIAYDESKLDEINAFNDKSFFFTVCGKDETATLDYLKENVDGFNECVNAATENNLSVYFQFSDDADNETTVNVLKQISNLDNFSKPCIPAYSIFSNDEINLINEMPAKYKAGDVNMNEKIDINDAIEVVKSIMNARILNDAETVLADADENGKINICDAIKIAKTLI